MLEKAYKLLALQIGTSNKKAKELIDKGVVSANGQKITVARKPLKESTVFKIKEIEEAHIIFEDDNILAVNKPAFLNAHEVSKKFPLFILLNRLDKETSGVMLFAKNEEFRSKAIKEYMKNNVYKEYVAIVEGKLIEKLEVNKPIVTLKGKIAKSKIDEEKGKPAKSIFYPYKIEGNKSKIKIVIENGRTHQIRVHAQSIGYPIIGDLQYGKKISNINRMMLHSKITKIFDYKFEAKEPKEFNYLGF